MVPPRFRKQERLPLSDRIAQEVREAIMLGDVTPGERLAEADLAEQMGVSRGTVREALQQLEHDGLVVREAYRGTTVAEFSHREVIEVLIPIRLRLETYAVETGWEAVTDETVARLEELVDAMREAAVGGDKIELVEADLGFHEELIKLGGSASLVQVWNGIVTRIRLHFMVQTEMYNDLLIIPEQHEELLDPLRARDLSGTLEALERHVVQYNLEKLEDPLSSA